MGLGKTIMIAALIHTNYLTDTPSIRNASLSSSEEFDSSSSEPEIDKTQSDGEKGKASLPKRQAVLRKNGKSVSKGNGAAKRASGRHGATLVVAPTSLLTQWKDELRRTSKDRLSVLVYNDQKDISHLADELDGGVDVVVVSYGKMGIEYEKNASQVTGTLARRPKDGLFAIDWYRIILDEVSDTVFKCGGLADSKACTGSQYQVT